jgi:D-3-phosphoglycerate dehydrogenase
VNRLKVLVCGRIHDDGFALLKTRPDVDWEVLDPGSVAEVEARAAEFDAIVVRTTPIRAPIIAKARRLKVVSRHGVGYDNVDVPALTERGIPLTVVGTANSVPVAEQAMAMMLAVTRQLRVYDAAVRSGNYKVRDSLAMVELAGKTVLVVGFGRIGTRVAKRCVAFDMNVVVADPFVPKRAIEGQGYRYVADFRDALPEADVVTFHMPGALDGRPVMGAAEFARLKRGAWLVNCARGTLIDEAALVQALTDGTLRGAGLDVTRDEPPAVDHPLLKLDNVILSPHSAGSTPECFARMAVVSVRNALDALDGRLDADMVVNPEVLN